MDKARGDRQRQAIYNFIREYHKDNGFAPSISEIVDGTGTVRSNVHRHLHILAQEGRITARPNTTRSWVIAR